ncbi:MAG: hypothetical protein WBP81_05235 [Solirubrobacteraceae bacterium]
MSVVPSTERPARDSIRRAQLNPSDTREAIFGSFDGMTSTLGVVAGLLATKSNASHIVAGAIGIAVAAASLLHLARIRFYRWAALPGERWEEEERQLRGVVVGFDRRNILLQISSNGAWPDLPGDSNVIEAIEPENCYWVPVIDRVPGARAASVSPVPSPGRSSLLPLPPIPSSPR